ncbi:MAG: response regulator [Candidatus Limnocylindria bacterium]
MTGPRNAEGDGPPNTRVEIVDDHLLFAQALGDLVGNLAGYTVVGIAQSGADAVKIAGETRPDLILLDFHLPGVRVTELMPELRSRSGRSWIVVLTSDTSEATRIAAMTAGADAFLTKDQALDEISDALAIAAPAAAPAVPAPTPRIDETFVPAGPVPTPPAPRHAERGGRVIAVYSPKGGVGTTTVAINLAVALAARPGARVGMLDLDLLFGDVAVMMDLRPARTVADLTWERRIDAAAIDELFTAHRSGVQVLAAPRGLASADLIDPDRVIAAVEELRAHFAYLVIDLATDLDRLTVDVLRGADRVVLVTTPELAALRQIARVLGRQPSLDLDERSLVVVNRSPGAASIPILDVERALERSVAVTIQSEGVAVTRAANAGEPLAGRGTSAARSFAGLAEQIASAVSVGRA